MLILHKYQTKVIRIIAKNSQDSIEDEQNTNSDNVKNILTLIIPLLGDVSTVIVEASGKNSGTTISKITNVVGRIAGIMCDSTSTSMKSPEIPKAQTFGDPSKPVSAASATVSGISSFLVVRRVNQNHHQPHEYRE